MEKDSVEGVWQQFIYKTECGELLIQVRDWNFSSERNYKIKITDEKNRDYIIEIPNANKYK